MADDDAVNINWWEFNITASDDDAWNWECLKAVIDVCKKHPGDKIPRLILKDAATNEPIGWLSWFLFGVDGSPELTQEAKDCPVYFLRGIDEDTRYTFLGLMPYRDYLKTPEWDTIKKRKRRQAGNRCQVCNASGVQLDVHHRTYENRGHELDEDLIVLCHECHGIFEKAGKLKECQDANV